MKRNITEEEDLIIDDAEVDEEAEEEKEKEKEKTKVEKKEKNAEKEPEETKPKNFKRFTVYRQPEVNIIYDTVEKAPTELHDDLEFRSEVLERLERIEQKLG